MRMTMGVLASAGASSPGAGIITVGSNSSRRGYCNANLAAQLGISAFGSISHPSIIAGLMWTDSFPNSIGTSGFYIWANAGTFEFRSVVTNIITLSGLSSAGNLDSRAVWRNASAISLSGNLPTTAGATVAYELVGVPGI